MRLNFITLILLAAWCWIPNSWARVFPKPQWIAASAAESMAAPIPSLLQTDSATRTPISELSPNNVGSAMEAEPTPSAPTPPGQEEIPASTDVRLMRGMILLAAISAAVILIGVWINRQRANLR
ncbi:MAG: hypothetical protein QME21_05690 [Anaerolineales bacterium]|nr:hypothetical protein [Anaerolineales bacterium]